MKLRWPHSAPLCLSPPATAKFPLAPVGVPVIHPPPVTKSPAQGGAFPAQVISACAEEIMTSAMPVTITCKAVTVKFPLLPLAEPDCSLITTCPCPFGSDTVWLGCPDTAIAILLMVRPAISELPLTEAFPFEQLAFARAIRKLAVIVLPSAVRFNVATDASERLLWPCPTVAACRTSAV